MRPHRKLTDDVSVALCTYLMRGHYKRAAAAMVGIHRDTLDDWERKGRTARAKRSEGLKLKAEEERLAAFSEAVEYAVDFGEGWLYEQMLEAAEGGAKDKHLKRWQAYMTALERSRPDRWRRRASSEYAGPKGQPAGRKLDVSKLAASERAALRELLQKARADDA